MFRIRRNQDVAPDVYARSGALFVQKMIQCLFTLRCGLRGDTITNLCRGIEDAGVVPIGASPPRPR